MNATPSAPVALRSRIVALLEVGAVFSLVLVVIWVLQLPPLSDWKRHLSARPFPEYLVMILLPLAMVAARRGDRSAYGLDFRDVGRQLDAGLRCAVPAAVAAMLLFSGLRLSATAIPGAFWHAGANLALLFVYARLLAPRPSAGGPRGSEARLYLAAGALTFSFTPSGRAVSGFLFYLCFLGAGEELLFRGYIQSRLNAAFGRPWRFFGTSWGWGAIGSSAFFGAMHVVNAAHTNPFLGTLELQWWWGFWTFFGGLAFAFLRERTGGVLAPALVHGLPPAVAALVFAA